MLLGSCGVCRCSGTMSGTGIKLDVRSCDSQKVRRHYGLATGPGDSPPGDFGRVVVQPLVGSRASAMLLRFRLAVAPRFLWECLNSRTVSWVPAPATSNPSCRFPAMGLPVCFRLRVMGPTRLAGLSVVTMVGEAGNLCRVPASRKATSYSTFANRILFAPGPASDVPEPSSPPSL